MAARLGILALRLSPRASASVLVSTFLACACVGGGAWRVAAQPTGETSPASPLSDTGADLIAPAPNEPARRVVLRFVTESEFPPFNYLDADGALTGFNVDLARAICLEVNATCDIKARPWEELYKAVETGEADGAIAAQRVTWAAVAKVEFTDRYMHTPGHFAGKRDGLVQEMTPEALEGQTIGVARGTAHEAYLKAFFHESAIKTFESVEKAREALADAKVSYLFDDAIGLGLWINGTNSRQCCEMKGAGFLEPKYFGDGIAIAVPKSDPQVKALLNSALGKVRESGRLEELVQRYFPVKIF